jgi:hypothetical protein
MTTLKCMARMLTLSYIFMMSVNPVLGISVSHGTDGASSSANYNLDTSTSLKEVGALGDGMISRISQVSGSGDNEISYQTSAKGNSVNSAIQSSGVLSATTSTIASSDVAVLSQDVASSGDLAAVVQGKSDSTSTEQMNAVLNGHISTSMNAFAGKDISTSGQSTTISGDAGATSSSSNSAENRMMVVGGFSGRGDLNTDLTSIAADHARIYGTASILGEKCIDDKALQIIASSDLAMEKDAIYAASNGELGNYGLTARNIVQSTRNSVSYQTAGWRWADNSKIHILLSGPTVSPAKSVAQEISKAANTWDLNTKQDLFKGSDKTNTAGAKNAVEIINYVPSFGDNMDGMNIHAWTRSLSAPTIAVTSTWYYTNQFVEGWDGEFYNRAFESDTWYNANYNWVIAKKETPYPNTAFDVRTIATHELGHTIGLTDVNGPRDTDKIMHGFSNGQVKWNLRNADKLGLWSLYGP